MVSRFLPNSSAIICLRLSLRARERSAFCERLRARGTTLNTYLLDQR
jgi:hypothetical protein